MEGGKIDQRGEEEIRMGNKRGRDEKGNIGRLEKKPSGMVVVEEYSGDEMINGVKYEEEKVNADAGGGGGLFNQLITNLVNSPKSNPTHDHVSDVKSEKNGGDGGGGGGGVINNLISNIFSSGNGNGNGNGNGGEVAVEKDDGDGDGDGDGEKEKDGGRNTIDNIVSQLPRTLSEDAAPATDEASILLHSIIHD